ncbi:hypothetical protein [Paenibacillus lactis]|uniref:Transposase n=1 Tax=Paenibacillus lactis TaxID=228574 RepID=A0ABS4F9Q3_9BACL|nr:hypothetical protein [Paenibacillus lactis]MBP1892990.1 hypothetical protein [Paenibacillus lactis]HAF97539.1 hypothetical protein [Paenibacillus lactis]
MDIKLTGVVKYSGRWRNPGEVLRKVDEEVAKEVIAADAAVEIEAQPDEHDTELHELRERAKELGVQNAGRLGEAKLKEGIAEKEAERKLKELQEKAFELGIADAYEKDAVTLGKEIEAAEQK